MVRLHQHADGVSAGLRVDPPRRRSGTALELVADHSGAAADVALGDCAAARAVERSEDVFVGHGETVDVVEHAVPRLGDHRQSPRLRLQSAVLQRPLERGVAHRADAVSIRDEDRPFKKAAFLDPRRAGHLPVAIQREPSRHDWIARRFSTRQDRRDARAHGSLADLQRPLTLDERREADFDAGHVGDRVQRPRCAFERDAEVARSGLGRLRGRERGHEQREQRRRGHALEGPSAACLRLHARILTEYGAADCRALPHGREMRNDVLRFSVTGQKRHASNVSREIRCAFSIGCGLRSGGMSNAPTM